MIKTLKIKNVDSDTQATILIQNKISYVPKVSVIIPIYNVEKYLRECLDSVINQTLQEIEIICIDDGSTDSSLDILKEYAAHDNRITVISQKNLRAGIARNTGLSVARGEYIHFLDSDDFIDISAYAQMVKNIENTDADFVYCSWQIKTDEELNSRNNIQPTNIPFINFHTFRKDKIKINVEIWNKLFRKSTIDKYNIVFPNSNYGEDVAFFMQYLFTSKNCFGINKPLYTYRIQSNSLMSNRFNNGVDSYKGISYTLSFLNKHDELKSDNRFYFDNVNNYINYLSATYDTPEKAMNYIKTFKQDVADKIDKVFIPNNTKLMEIKNENYQSIFNQLFPEFNYPDKPKEYYDLQYTGLLDNRIKVNTTKIDNIIDIVFIMDTKYFLCSYIAITSLIHSKNKNSGYNINIIHTNLSDRQCFLLSLLENTDIHINIIGFNAKKYADIKNVYHITNTALIKFDIPNIFKNLNKILYIDGDILVQQDLSGLFDIDLKDNYIAATKEMQATLRGYDKIVGTQHYINSGVMLINLKKMREDNIPQKMINKKMNQPETWKCMDQDVFNYICDGKIHFLDVAYNNTISIFIKNKWKIKEINDFYKTNYKNIKELINKSVILHFAGDLKPWIYNIKTGNISANYLQIMRHSLMEYNLNNFKKLKNIHSNKCISSYLFAFLYFLTKPIIKFIKHWGKIFYNHSYRGKTDMLNMNFRKIMQQIENLQKNINMQNEKNEDKFRELGSLITNINNKK